MVHTEDHGNRQVSCTVCDKVFKGNYRLRSHISKYHPQEKQRLKEGDEEEDVYSDSITFGCAFCGEACDTQKELEQHVLDRHMHEEEEEDNHDEVEEGEVVVGDEALIVEEKLEWLCANCSQTFTERPDYVLHTTKCFPSKPAVKLETISCPICPEVFTREKLYEQHIKSHYKGSEDNKCLLCDKKFKHLSSVAIHTEEHGSRELPCDQCGRLFKGRMQLVGHRNKYHQVVTHKRSGQLRQVELHVCSVCGKTFTQGHRLNQHMLSHSGERPFACEHCGQGFKTRRNLGMHQLTHTGEKNVKCLMCDLTFFHEKHMKDHMKRRHMNTQRFGCEICGKQFSYSSGLNEHMNTHTKQKQYQCEYCDKVFHKVSILYRHKTIHTGEMRKKCKICAEMFKRSEHLAKHMREEHAGERVVETRGRPDPLTVNEWSDEAIIEDGEQAEHVEEVEMIIM